MILFQQEIQCLFDSKARPVVIRGKDIYNHIRCNYKFIFVLRHKFAAISQTVEYIYGIINIIIYKKFN